MRKRDPNRIEMGRRFREARERLNWSREVLAERADLSVSFIADLELETPAPGWRTLSACAACWI